MDVSVKRVAIVDIQVRAGGVGCDLPASSDPAHPTTTTAHSMRRGERIQERGEMRQERWERG